MRILFIIVFGILGVLSRYFFGGLVERLAPSPFPVGTLMINVAGSFAIGVVYVLGVERAILARDLWAGIMVGFLGGFTTFSSYSLDVFRLLEARAFLSAIAYFSLSPLFGLGAAFAGVFLARQLVP